MTKTRVLASLIMAPVAIAAVLLLSTPWIVALSAVLFLAGLWEWFRLAEIEDGLARGILLLANLLLMVALVWASSTDSSGSLVLFKLLTVAGVVWWLLAMLWLRHPGFASDHDTHARVIKLAAATASVIPAWCALALIHAGQPHGHRWLLIALAMIWAADSGAYFAGRRFGRRKLAPTISPNKTVEGLAGGLVAGVLLAVLAAPLAGAELVQLPLVALVALLTILFSVVGDLYESLLKRHVGAKDSGTMIPGHGGLLDRIDSVLAALPVFALGQIWFGF
ncbi:phosphatidate cytidylyltransferase [Luteimonas suaedae]|uniref:phosphatidate cytidylyltransferase n=1 Tax=Luteimonas suaedae TaxID=2605430 RepID=UPI0011EF6605|nr:phosphatidate cytidylyltransferase [Luteimonas suaedae]